MNVKRKRIIICIAVTLLVIIMTAGFAVADEMNGMKMDETDFLHVEQGRLVNARGEEVVLQGVNLGGWLLQESWMCPVSGENRKWANLDTITVLENRFGEEKTAELIQSYQDNWITQWDIENIASMGCNVIRVPFWYRNFMKDTNGTWITENPDENPGFQRLDWIIEQAGKNDMYVILDMHGCPGGQSMDHCCGTLCQNNLYTDETCLNTMELLWRTISNRYRDNPVVAAYDIMNEPQNNSGYEGEHNYDPWQQASWEMSNAVYDRMIHAIRGQGDNHVISVEGIWRISNLPDPAARGWNNMLYQLHLYDDDTEFAKWTQSLADARDQYGVAGYVGEFQNLNGIAMCQAHNLSWTTWTYKGTDSDIDTFFWYFGYEEDADVVNDSYEEILEKWGSNLQTKNFMEKINVTEFIRSMLETKEA